jgi:hypothetical protein
VLLLLTLLFKAKIQIKAASALGVAAIATGAYANNRQHKQSA